MRKILYVLLIISTGSLYAASNFDRMRCKGQLIHKGESIKKLIALCGKPDFAKKVANQYVEYYKISYSSRSRGKYFLLFKNGLLIRSEHVIYGSSKYAWKLPDGD